MNAVADVHIRDFIFQFVLSHPDFPNRQGAVAYYFHDGRNSAEQFKSLLTNRLDLRFGPKSPIEILEFASGYGCVTRHFKNVMPGADIIACDIHKEALQFISEKIGVETIPSSTDPGDFNVGQRFDVVFALSFFSHIPDRVWGGWLAALFSHVKPGGYLVLTTHGLASAKYFGNPALDDNGHWFLPDSEQKDLPTTDYGQTIVAPHYVLNQVFTLPGRALLANFKYAYWWGHQDLYVLSRPMK